MTRPCLLPTAVLYSALALGSSALPWGAPIVATKNDGAERSPMLAQTIPAGTVVSGGGLVTVTDIDGNTFPAAGEFTISGAQVRNGARGRISFVFRGDFASFWGAVPGVTDLLYLKGNVDNVTVDGSNVVIGGLLSETDFAQGHGVVFVEENVPFEITAQPGSTSFVMQFCELPPFAMQVTEGTLAVHAGSQLALDASPAPPILRLASATATQTRAASRPQCAR